MKSWTPEVWLAFFGFLTFGLTQIFQIVQNYQIKNQIKVHDAGSVERQQVIEAEIKNKV
jgi:hypothetical protein